MQGTRGPDRPGIVDVGNRRRVMMPDRSAAFLRGANKCESRYWYSWLAGRRRLQILRRLSPEAFREAATIEWGLDLFEQHRRCGFNMLSKLAYGFGQDESYQPKPWDSRFGWWMDSAIYRLAEAAKFPHLVNVPVYPPRHVFEDHSDWPEEEKRRQQFPDVWSDWWRDQVGVTARQACETFAGHRWLVGCVLGVEPPFVAVDRHLDDPHGAWTRTTWAIRLWQLGPQTPARRALVDGLGDAGVGVDGINAILAQLGSGDRLEAVDELYDRDPDLPHGAFEGVQLPPVFTRAAIRAISIQYHAVVADAMRSHGWRHLLGSADFAGNVLEPSILEGAGEAGCDFFSTHDYRAYPSTPEAKCEKLSEGVGLMPYFLLEFAHIDDGQGQRDHEGNPVPPGYPHVANAAEKIDGYARHARVMPEQRGCLGMAVHAGPDHVFYREPETRRIVGVGQWAYMEVAEVDDEGHVTSRPAIEYEDGLREANSAIDAGGVK